MKNLVLIFAICSTFILSTSCEDMFGDYLEKAPGVDVTIDTLFSSQAQVETLVTAIYNQGMPDAWGAYGRNEYPVSYVNGSTNYAYDNAAANSSITDETEGSTAWFYNQNFNAGNINVNTTLSWDKQYHAYWYVIRQVAMVLENIDRVPADQAFIDRVIGEVKFLRALDYFELWKHYGGQPLIDKALSPSDEFNIPQSSVDSTVQFILKDCDDAIALLPDKYSSELVGHATKGAALALKAKTLLYAASPQWNTETPYLSMDNPADNRLICYENYDVNRWKLAADAAKAVLDWAPAGGIELVTDQGVENNHKYTFEVSDNSEQILGTQAILGGTANQDPWRYFCYPYWTGAWSGFCPTQNFIEKFYDKRDGTPQTWSNSGTDLNQKYAELDYRFKQDIGYNGNYFSVSTPQIETFLGPDGQGLHASKCVSGYWTKKPVSENFRDPTGRFQPTPKWNLFRLADAYLWYAEALNEYYSTPPQEAYDAINIIRQRSGMPDLPTGLTQAEFRERLRKERAVEFYMEDSRWWDIRRWLAADEGVMYGDMYGLKIYKIPDTTPQEFRYEKFVFETRVWNDNLYLFPNPPSEVNKGVLKQNPGW